MIATPIVGQHKAVIRLHRVSKSYREGGQKTRVLHHLSLHARTGQITTIMGPSGSGKTTLLRIMGGLARPDSGLVTVHDQDLYGARDTVLSHYRNSTIGFIFQDYRLLDNYNAIENVMLPLMIAGVGKREQVKKATRALRLVGLESFRHRRVGHLSGGQEQRVSIARALAMRPTILLADEPTGNLDSARGADIMQLFQRLRTSERLSIVMVTHDEHLATQSDHLVTIVDGRVRDDVYASR